MSLNGVYKKLVQRQLAIGDDTIGEEGEEEEEEKDAEIGGADRGAGDGNQTKRKSTSSTGDVIVKIEDEKKTDVIS